MGRLQGWGGLRETPEKLEGRSPSSAGGGGLLLAQRQVTSSLVLGKEKPVGEEDGGKLRGFIWMAFIFPVSVMGEELNPAAPWYGSSSDAGRGSPTLVLHLQCPAPDIPQSSGQGKNRQL